MQGTLCFLAPCSTHLRHIPSPSALGRHAPSCTTTRKGCRSRTSASASHSRCRTGRNRPVPPGCQRERVGECGVRGPRLPPRPGGAVLSISAGAGRTLLRRNPSLDLGREPIRNKIRCSHDPRDTRSAPTVSLLPLGLGASRDLCQSRLVISDRHSPCDASTILWSRICNWGSISYDGRVCAVIRRWISPLNQSWETTNSLRMCIEASSTPSSPFNFPRIWSAAVRFSQGMPKAE